MLRKRTIRSSGFSSDTSRIWVKNLGAVTLFPMMSNEQTGNQWLFLGPPVNRTASPESAGQAALRATGGAGLPEAGGRSGAASGGVRGALDSSLRLHLPVRRASPGPTAFLVRPGTPPDSCAPGHPPTRALWDTPRGPTARVRAGRPSDAPLRFRSLAPGRPHERCPPSGTAGDF